eukprot:CAMPEP_0197577606 /NCGR_PEP_ID=MMETSP1326-20131121/2175_1 /TAXON_ID=1155430 /ORGANISM="Genus nov. species nov., Strain RCC2288" /LENGTH=94 /DNA_ID=CAMNT_0043140701 /DNA_START=479 /DNA_END=763 /DNA_ORIENTATION=+
MSTPPPNLNMNQQGVAAAAARGGGAASQPQHLVPPNAPKKKHPTMSRLPHGGDDDYGEVDPEARRKLNFGISGEEEGGAPSPVKSPVSKMKPLN